MKWLENLAFPLCCWLRSLMLVINCFVMRYPGLSYFNLGYVEHSIMVWCIIATVNQDWGIISLLGISDKWRVRWVRYCLWNITLHLWHITGNRAVCVDKGYWKPPLKISPTLRQEQLSVTQHCRCWSSRWWCILEHPWSKLTLLYSMFHLII